MSKKNAPAHITYRDHIYVNYGPTKIVNTHIKVGSLNFDEIEDLLKECAGAIEVLQEQENLCLFDDLLKKLHKHLNQ